MSCILESHLGWGWSLVACEWAGLCQGRGWWTSGKLEAGASNAEGEGLLVLEVNVILQLLLLLLAQREERDSLW